MAKRFTALLLVLLLLTGCTTQQNSISPQPGDTDLSLAEDASAPQDDLEQRRLDIINENANISGGLSQTQMLEDYEHLWDNLRTGYPFFGVIQRAGVDPEEVYQRYLDGIADLNTDLDFLNHLANMTREMGNAGHLQVMMSYYFFDYCHEVYSAHADELPLNAYLASVLETPQAEECYAAIKVIDDQVNALYASDEPAPAPETDEEALEQEDGVLSTAFSGSGNIETALLEDNTVAYVKIGMFDSTVLEADYEELYAFYQEIADLPHLIIDVRGNGGGADAYWNNNIVNLLTTTPYTLTQYALFNSQAPANQAYYDVLTEGTVLPLSELPAFPALQQDDLVYFDSLLAEEQKIVPSEDSIDYSGKIWLLVDERVYSSSETFSMFCKQTGFATLVGTSTNGDGGGSDPNIFVLPNSGITLRYSIFYTINADGSNSEEAGTTPDILTGGSEEALQACLDAIKSA